ncbi:hypothetical protein M0R72_21810 [Candidatus Pacearchaeota archaeon]|jgi:hypothetical protein|nr:hypothetical protein [Candidatus Pacearchaeota archaeon]
MKQPQRDQRGRYWSIQADARRDFIALRTRREMAYKRQPQLFALTFCEELGAMQRTLERMKANV